MPALRSLYRSPQAGFAINSAPQMNTNSRLSKGSSPKNLGKSQANIISPKRPLRDMHARPILDKRRMKSAGTYPLIISITFRSQTVRFPLHISLLPDQWDEKKRAVVRHPQAPILNTIIKTRIAEMDTTLLQLQLSGELDNVTTTKGLKEVLTSHLSPEEDQEETTTEGNFLPVFRQYADSRNAPRTKEIYQNTIRTLEETLGEELSSLSFEDITPSFLRGLEERLRVDLAINTIAIHLRNIRAVCSFAFNEGITSSYPFRKFKIKHQATRKRSLSVEELREFFSAEVTDDQRPHLDMFKLIFLLIGINIIDLSRITTIEQGRINYRRAKTGKLYSIKVEPEALEIINKYRGTDHLLSFFDTYKKPQDYTSHINKGLKKIGRTEIGKQGKRTYHPLQPELSVYWARHSWATIAASLDIPKETIAHALGHGSETVTDVYIDFDLKKVDQANRQVIDWVLYNKK